MMIGTEAFPALLKRFRERSGLSQNALADRIDKDPGTVNRLESGKRAPVNRETLEALAEALSLSADERNDLLVAAGHVPDAFERITLRDPDLRLVAEVLADEALPADERQEFRLAVRLAARRFRRVGLGWIPADELPRHPRADSRAPVEVHTDRARER